MASPLLDDVANGTVKTGAWTMGGLTKDVDWDILSSYGGLLALAVFAIYAGSHNSLPKSKNQKHSRKKKDDDASEDEADDDVTDDEEEEMERMSADDAWLFPIIGSGALLSLYLIVKYVGTVWLNRLLGWYFAIAGVGSLWQSFCSLMRFAVGNARWREFERLRFTVEKGQRVIASAAPRWPSLVLLLLAVVPSTAYVFVGAARRSVLLTDILGLSFATNAISLLRLDSFRTGCILLAGLFVYDVWWVFGTEVMVKVATTLDVPIKLLWPKSILLAAGRGHTMLGLGDVVIPGTFVALALRYDAARGTGGKGCFWAAMGGYVVGLGVTMGVMHIFGKAQPALLYLSPSCILAVGLWGVARGELQGLWIWTDGPERGKVNVE